MDNVISYLGQVGIDFFHGVFCGIRTPQRGSLEGITIYILTHYSDETIEEKKKQEREREAGKKERKKERRGGIDERKQLKIRKERIE